MSAKNDAKSTVFGVRRKDSRRLHENPSNKKKNDWKKIFIEWNKWWWFAKSTLPCKHSTPIPSYAQRGSVSEKKVHILRFTQANILFIHLLWILVKSTAEVFPFISSLFTRNSGAAVVIVCGMFLATMLLLFSFTSFSLFFRFSFSCLCSYSVGKWTE